jgi:glycosyltransferase involved in cell wall biosynthesis
MRVEPRVLFLISVMGHGRGGHFYSLRTTAEALAAEFPCMVVMLGRHESPIVGASSVPARVVRTTGWNLPSALGGLLAVIRDWKPTVLHAFDVSSHALARLAGARAGLPVVTTKAGGPNPKRFFPLAEDIVLFSSENMEFFSAHPKFRGVRLHHIANRAVEIDDDAERIAAIRQDLDPARPTLMRIARFNPHYRESIVQAVSLTKRLNADGASCQLVLVGTPQIPEVHREIVALKDEHIHIYSDDRFTVEASRLLGVADFVVATGRSIMEASSKGRVLLTPLAGGSIPALVTTGNFPEFFATNFSPRNRLPDYDEESNYARIRELVRGDKAGLEDLKRQSRDWFERHFSIRAAVPAYRAIYEGAMQRGRGGAHPLDALIHVAMSVRQFALAEQ